MGVSPRVNPDPNTEEPEGSRPTARHETVDAELPTAAWTEGHRRVFEYLCKSTEHPPDGVDGLAPLYQAIPHGCHAGLHERARADVYRDRILRGTGHDGWYSWKEVGAIGANLGAVACFFDQPWSRLSPNFEPAVQTWLLNEAAHSLRALGRLPEAVEPMRVGMDQRIEQEDWRNAAISAGNLSELELTLGDVSAAISDGEQGVEFADKSGEWTEKNDNRVIEGDARHQAGGRDDAKPQFVAAEATHAEHQPQYPRFYSVQGFRYCDLLLSRAERAAWQATLRRTGFRPVGDEGPRCRSANQS